MTEIKKQIVKYFMNNGVLVSNTFLNFLNDENDLDELYSNLLDNGLSICNIKNNEVLSLIKKEETTNEGLNNVSTVKIISNYEDFPIKRKMSHFVTYFNNRYNKLRSFLMNRMELQNTISIHLLSNKKDNEPTSLIGIVYEVSKTKNGHIMITLEDPTGMIKVLFSKNKQKLFELAQEIVPDEVIGINGNGNSEIFFAKNLFFPEIPLTKELKKSPYPGYAVFTGDVHIGSIYFKEENFLKFIKWLNGELGSDKQKEMAKNIKYLFIVGDLVDGVGIYPGQEEELEITDIYKQYEKAAEYLKKIPSHIKIIITGGNHDAMRISEPQPKLYDDFAKPLYKLSNIIMATNPSIINIHSTKDFPGFDVLLYHGYSFDYYANNVEVLRNKGSYRRSDLIMKFLLQKRHLAPTHSSTLVIPDTRFDPLIIEKIPDFFITGHIHYSMVSSYRNITLISGSCWQSSTSFQEKMGHNPEVGRVSIVNLQNREIKVIRF